MARIVKTLGQGPPGPVGPPGPQGVPGVDADTTKLIGGVIHGADANVLRPTGFAKVQWTGSVAPVNAVDNDDWIRTGV